MPINKGAAQVAIKDNSSSGYVDIGAIRIQWGQTTAYSFSFPAAFKNTSYSFVGTISGTGSDVYEVHIHTKTATGIQVTKRYDNTSSAVGLVSGYTIDWCAIGLKP